VTTRRHPRLTADLADGFARLALANVAREYPTKLDHVINGPGDCRTPAQLHPLFHGSFDWHSCVHAHWMLARLLRLFPDAPFADAIRQWFAGRFIASNVEGELDYLAQPNRSSFVRTYGWAWLLKLATELDLGSRGASIGETHDASLFATWRDTLAPLTARFVDLYLTYLPQARVPLRYGLHPNSAFGVAFALDYATFANHPALRALCCEKALDWFARDTDYPARFEPSGNEFLSPALVEADLMRRVLDRPAFRAWLQRFLPPLGQAAHHEALFTPVDAGDHSDPQTVHLDGLNFSRAWCLDGIATAIGAGDARHAALTAAASAHIEAGLPHVQSGNYMGEHWLATFAVHAMTPDAPELS
jgi:hypothetical protein